MKRFLSILILTLLPFSALADVQIKSGASSDVLTVDATSKAARFTEYDTRGNVRGQKASYSAGLAIRTNTAAGTGPFFTICGSATKTVRVQRFYASGSVATAAVRGDVILKKTSTATSAGTATTLTQVPHDSNSGVGTAALVNFYTVLATAGTSVGVVGSRFGNFPITATVASTDQIFQGLWDFAEGDELEAVVLRGTAQCMEANFATTTTNVPTLVVYVKWTEEP